MKKITVDISGMGGEYEAMCQTMLWRGVLHLAEVKPPFTMWSNATEYKNIYGVMDTRGDDLKALERSIIHKGDDVTGAMHQCVMGHLRKIHEVGIEKWLELVREHDSDRIYEVEVTL